MAIQLIPWARATSPSAAMKSLGSSLLNDCWRYRAIASGVSRRSGFGGFERHLSPTPLVLEHMYSIGYN